MAEKITEEQLVKLQDIVNRLNKIQLQLGIIETQKHELLHATAEIQMDLQSNRKKLEEEYGNVSIDVGDGTITEKTEQDALDKKD
jgi:uncharacterized protein YoxC